jgi:hypothetical protein
MTNHRDICPKCGWPLQSCECCGLCGEPNCDCQEALNGDTSEPLGDGSLLSDETIAMLDDIEHEEYP